MRGVDGFFFEGGSRLEILTGKTIVIFGERRRNVRVARAPRPLNPAFVATRGSKLPPPARGALAGKLRC